MSVSKKFATAALAGLLFAGFMTATVVHAADAEKTETATPAAEKHACKGQNSCKGNGGCKTDKNECAGKNECKAAGGCATDGSKMPK